MDADLEDFHPDMQRILKKNKEYMATQKPRKRGTPMTPPAGWEDEDEDEEEE